MGVTAVMMDTVHEKSGHTMAPNAVSVCTTPAAPSPVPIPYPPVANVAEGSKDAPRRTKFCGAKIVTVGACFKACHGNEPGTLKETLSLNTGGPCFLVAGAPIVFVELGMAGITGSPGFMNKGMGGMRTAPAPDAAAPPGMCPGIAVLAGGGGGGGGDGNGSGGKDGAGGDGDGSGEDASGDGKDGGEGCGDPVCPITGRMFLDVLDFAFAGPLPLRWQRHYNSRQSAHAGEFGHGWSHDYGWRIRDSKRRSTELFDDQNRLQVFPKLTDSADGVRNALSWTLRREGERFSLLTPDRIRRDFGSVRVDGFHYLESETDRNGNTIRIERDSHGALIGLVDSAGRPYRVEVDGRRRITRVLVAAEPTHQQWMEVARYSYDDVGDLVSAADAEGYAAGYVYHRHLMVEHRTPSGLSYCYRYDGVAQDAYCVESWGEYLGKVDPALEKPLPARPEGVDRRPVKGIFHRRFLYLKDQRFSEVETSIGGVERYFGDEAGRVIKSIDAAGGVNERTFDPEDGGLRAHSDERGAVFRVTPNADGRPDGHVGPDGKGTRSLPGDEPRSRLVVDEHDGSVVKRVEDERGNEIFVGYPDGTSEEFVYDERGLFRRMHDRRGAVTTFHHDGMGNCVAIELPGGGVEVSQYDYLGRRTRHESRSAVVTEWTWDRRSEVIGKTHGDGSAIHITRDANRQITAFEENGAVTRYEYGGQAWLTRITAPDGGVTEIKYDTEGHVTSMRNARDQVHRQWFDQAGRWTGCETFEGLQYGAGYATSGECIWRATPVGREAFEHDEGGALIAAEAPDGQAFTIAYDHRGGPKVIDNGVARIERAFDVLGRVTEERCGGYVTKIAYEGGDIQSVWSSVGVPISYRRDATGRARQLVAGQARLDLDKPAGGDLLSRLGDHLIRRQHFGPTGLLLRQSFARVDPRVTEAEVATSADPNLLLWSSYEYRHGVLVGEHHSDGRTIEYDLTPAEQVAARRVSRRGVTETEERLRYDAAGTPIVHGARYDRLMRPVEIHGEELSYDDAGRLVGRMTDRGAWTYPGAAPATSSASRRPGTRSGWTTTVAGAASGSG
jgi:YD repeat-containing protein